MNNYPTELIWFSPNLIPIRLCENCMRSALGVFDSPISALTVIPVTLYHRGNGLVEVWYKDDHNAVLPLENVKAVSWNALGKIKPSVH